MALALEFGMPVGMMTKVMTEPEFAQWSRFARRRMLPLQRLEIYLAQIAMMIARTMGGATDAKLSDFMIQTLTDQEVQEEEDLEALKEAFGFNPRPRRVAEDEDGA